MAIDYIEEKYHHTEVFHDMINKVLEQVAQNKKSDIPHEWYFIKVLKEEIKKDNHMAEKFVMYIAQYYKDYKWLDFNPKNYVETVIIECVLQEYQFLQQCDLGNDSVFSNLSQSMLFGAIATDFLIRYRGYSLIKSSGQKIIITARNDCEKRFEELIYQDYSLQRKERVIYIDISELGVNPNLYKGVTGIFHRLPVIPTSIDYPVEEIIETKGKQYEYVFQQKKNNK